VTACRQPFRPEAVLKIGWRRKWQIILPAIVIAAASSLWIYRLSDRYRSDALLLIVPQRVPEAFVRSTVTTRADHRLQQITQQILSRTELEQIIRDFDLYADQRKTASMEEIVDSMRARDIEIRLVKGDAFRLGFSSNSPGVAMRVVERLVALFVVEASLDRATLAEGTDRFLEGQLEDAGRKLSENEAKLSEYRRRHNGELPSQVDANVRGLHNTEMQLQVLTDSLNRDRDRQVMLERSLKDASLSELIETRGRIASDDTSQLTAAEQLERAEAALKDMRSTLTEQHPDIVTLKGTIAELRKRTEAENAGHVESAGAEAERTLRRSRLHDLRAELSAVERQIAQKVAEGERLRGVLLNYQRRIEVAPTREAELAALTRDYDTLQQTYRGLLAKKQESQIAANLERQPLGAHFKVLDPARLPEQPFAPKRPLLYALAVLAGFGISLMFAVTLEWFDRGMRTQEDVRTGTALPMPPSIPNRKRTGKDDSVMAAGSDWHAAGESKAKQGRDRPHEVYAKALPSPFLNRFRCSH
jgi:polysaccharide chain length determinant protein (PEP-CTERM system associated)